MAEREKNKALAKVALELSLELQQATDELAHKSSIVRMQGQRPRQAQRQIA